VLAKLLIDREMNLRKPYRIKWEFAAPSEDGGRVPGFDKFLLIMRDPNYPEYKEMCW